MDSVKVDLFCIFFSISKVPFKTYCRVTADLYFYHTGLHVLSFVLSTDEFSNLYFLQRNFVSRSIWRRNRTDPPWPTGAVWSSSWSGWSWMTAFRPSCRTSREIKLPSWKSLSKRAVFFSPYLPPFFSANLLNDWNRDWLVVLLWSQRESGSGSIATVHLTSVGFADQDAIQSHLRTAIAGGNLGRFNTSIEGFSMVATNGEKHFSQIMQSINQSMDR